MAQEDGGEEMTRVRQTSIDVYREIEASGLLSKTRQDVYSYLFHNGPLTAGEIFMGLNKVLVKGSVCARLTELERLGVILEVGVKPCSLTGMTATLWDVTNQLPIKSEELKAKKIWYGVISPKREDKNRIFRNRADALKYKFKEDISAPIHEFEED